MASMNEKDYYAVLGVSKDADTSEIRRAFQRKARTLHPDVNKEPDAEERFKEVSEAYAVLSDEGKRKRYDAMRRGSPFAGYSSAPGGAQSPFGGAAGWPGSPFGWDFPFGGQSRRSSSRSYNPRAGADVTFQLDLDEQLAAKGCRRGVTYQRYVPCDVCDGKGSVEHEHAETCPTCGGTGHMSVDLSGIFGFGVMEMQCPECEGTGKVVADPCHNCGGSGRVLSASEVVVEVPAGSHDGDEIRVTGMGNAGTNGREAGDFVCRVGVPTERLSRRQSFGFQLLGFALPLAVVALLTHTIASMAFAIVVPAVMGCLYAFREGVAHPKTWWRHGAESMARGASTGLMLALLTLLMQSCSVLGRAGYVG